jgi:dTDP-4-dehydrorhamnose reductase
MSRIMETLITHFPESSGIYHVSSYPISKFDLLNLIREKFGLAVELVPDHDFKLDRSLDSTRFRRDFGYTPPTWKSMIDELAAENKIERP